jgi:AsmA protein
VKRVLTFVGFFVGLLISSVIILALLVDANMFKPRISALAQEKGIALDMRGDLHWQFWPSIGLAVNDLDVASVTAPKTPVAQFKKVSFLIAFMPLMRGEFEVKHVIVDGANIRYELNKQAKSNWDDIIKAQETKTPSDEPIKNTDTKKVTSSDLHLVIEKISLHNSSIVYLDETKGQRSSLTDLNLDLDNVNTDAKPFELKLSWTAQHSKAEGKTQGKAVPLIVKGKLQNTIVVAADYNALQLNDGSLTLDIQEKSSISIALKYSVKVDSLKNNPRYQGQLSLPSINARQLLSVFGASLNTANPNALTEVNFSAQFSGDSKHITLNPLKLGLDKTHLDGSVAVTDFAASALKLSLQGDDINVDDYLAPVVESPTPAPVSTATGDEVLLPLDTLRALNADIKIAFNNIIFSGLTLEKIQLDVDAKNGNIKQQLKANAYSGSIVQHSHLDARGQSAQMRFDAALKGLELAPLLKAKKMDKSLNLSGAIQADASGQASGVSMNKIMESLVANANFSGAQVRLAPLNIEQQFCKFLNLVNKVDDPEKTWNTFTEMRELSGKVNIAKRIVTIETFNAGVEKLLLSSTGKINLASNEYDFLLPLKLSKDAVEAGAAADTAVTSAQGCGVGSNYWAERGMSLLRCKGSFAEINPLKDCRPDKAALVELTKDFAEFKLREKHGAKVEAKKAELIKKVDDKINEKLGGEGGAEKAKTLLKGLFNKKRDE